MKFEDTFIGRPNTIATYCSLFKHHIEPFVWGDSHKSEMWAKHMIKAWEEKGLSVRTRQILLRLLKDYISFLGGPAINIKRLGKHLERSEQQKETVVLNKDQTATLMKTCKQIDIKFYPILLLGLHAGLRRGEIFGLRCGDVNVLKNKIRVAYSYDGPTKNGKTRYVPMSTELQNAMIAARNLLMRRIDEKVFEQMDPNPRLRRLLKCANLPRLRFHDLRHTFATLALENGVSPKQVSSWLGHSNVTTTLSIYWNLAKDETDINQFLPTGEQ